MTTQRKEAQIARMGFAPGRGWTSAIYDRNKLLKFSQKELEYNIRVSIDYWYCSSRGQAALDERFHEDFERREAWWMKECAHRYNNQHSDL